MAEFGQGGYKNVVAQIINLRWDCLTSNELRQLMYLSYIAALEFAGSLRIAAVLFQDSPAVQQLVAGELNTRNLVYDDYGGPGDHADFLKHFLRGAAEPLETVRLAGEEYSGFCNLLPREIRAMSVFSREAELPGIFNRILRRSHWSGRSLCAYQHFLRVHVQLDAESGGHRDLTKEFLVDDRVKGFWCARLEMYRSIPSLFA